MQPSCAEHLKTSISWKSKRDGRRYVFVKESKSSPLVIVRVEELENFPYFFLRYLFPAVHIDVDDITDKNDLFSSAFYSHLGVPLPSIVVLTERGAHVLYLLAYPVSRHGKGFVFLRNVRTGLIYALNGDFGCRLVCAIRNPFYTKADTVFFHSGGYELAKLDLGIKRIVETQPCFNSAQYAVGNRNRATFSYLLTVFKGSPDLSFNDLYALAEAYQAEQESAPLSRSENTGIVTSILRNGHRYILGNPNRGILGLQPRESFLPLEEFRAWKAERQALGAGYARAALMEQTREKVFKAVEQLTASGKPTGVRAVARMARVSSHTASKYLSGCSNLLHQE